MLPYQMLRRAGGDFIDKPVHVTGKSERRKLLQESGLNIQAASSLDDAAEKIVKAIKA
jgi:hypothetical protein